jgi:cyclophilin family peptidyl-prolyl cis-trans isomerase
MHVRVCLVIVAAGLMVVAVGQVRGQDQPKKTATKSSTKAAGGGARDPRVVFDAQLVEWKKILAELRKNTLEVTAARPSDREKLMEQREEIFARGNAMMPKIKKSAEAAYVAAPNNNGDAELFIRSMVDDAMDKEEYEEALRLANVLIAGGYENKNVYNVAGKAAFDANDFEAAGKYLKIAKEANMLEESPGQVLLSMVDDYQKKWQKEAELRAEEAKADDLPQVSLKTTKGDIVLELFENQAPNTVANFIRLVEKGFYNDTPFHRVMKGFMAQGGDPTGEGKGGPGYTIPCECYRDDHRIHFRGSLSMAHTGDKDTGGSQFFLTFTPTTHLDGKHTVFGRIIDGIGVLSKLERRDPIKTDQPKPDKIIEATVLRKRDHKYEPATLAK